MDKPAGLSDMFPDVDRERVEKLMQTDEFKARQAIIDLGGELYQRKQRGEDVSGLVALLHIAQSLVMKAMSDKLYALGYKMPELSAAAMAASGFITLEE